VPFFFFVEAEIFMHNAASTNTQIFLLLLYTNTTDPWKRYLPIKLDPMHLPEEVPKVAWANFGEVLVEGTLLPSLRQIPPLLPKNLNINHKINGSDIFRSITADNQLPLKCLLPGILLT
jgi:hypothetical protein